MIVELTESARRDLGDAVLFYQAPSPLADLFLSTIESALLHLQQWPYTGHRRRDLTKEDLCFFSAYPYLLAFRVRGELLSVIAMLHAARNISRELRRRIRWQEEPS